MVSLFADGHIGWGQLWGGFCRLLKNWGSGKEGVTQWGAPPQDSLD